MYAFIINHIYLNALHSQLIAIQALILTHTIIKLFISIYTIHKKGNIYKIVEFILTYVLMPCQNSTLSIL